MTHTPYDYENRDGILPISWNAMHGLCKALVAGVAPFDPEVIVPIGRGGFYPGTLIAHLLRVEVYPVRVSRRVQDVVVHEEPQWLTPPAPAVKGRRVLIVDEISSTGGTLHLVKAAVLSAGATAARSAVLYAHSWSTATPDYIGLVSDALILNPWDREIYADGAFQVHPEYVAALSEQGIAVDEGLLIPAPTYRLAKATP